MTKGSGRTELLQLLGLAQRAGAVVRGTDAVRRTLKAGGVHLVLTASDASRVQLDKFEGLLQRRGVPRIIPGDRRQLGAALGVAPLSAAGVTEKAWAIRLQRGADASAVPD